MLYDSKRWPELKPFTNNELLFDLDRFIAFLETKNPEENYYFTDAANCAVAQYLKAYDMPVFNIGKLPQPILGIVMGEYGEYRTFGSALHRARKARRWQRIKNFFKIKKETSHAV